MSRINQSKINDEENVANNEFRKYLYTLERNDFYACKTELDHGKWVPVTTAWRVLRLRMEERPPIWRVASDKLNKQSQISDEGWSYSFGVGRGANNPPRENPF
jgi:hypothetical protein